MDTRTQEMMGTWTTVKSAILDERLEVETVGKCSCKENRTFQYSRQGSKSIKRF